MLKPVAIVSAFIIWSAFVFKEPIKGVHKNDLENYNLKGRVKSCTEYHHEINDPKFLKIFNPKIKETIITTFYDRKGYRTKMIDSEIDSSGKVIRFHSHTLDLKARKENELLAARHIVYNKFKQPIVIYRYSKGQMDTIYYLDKKGKLKLRYVYHYDKNQDIIIGKAVYKTLYLYDKYNNRVEEIDLDAKGRRISKKNYQYDSRGNVLLEIDSAVFRWGSNVPKKTKSNIYTISHAYKIFDKAGNWLQQTTVDNNERSYSTKRKIKYYN